MVYKDIYLYEKSTFILNLSYRALFFYCIKSFILIQGNDDELNALRLQMESLLKKKDEEIALFHSSLREQPPQEGNSQQCCGGCGVPKRKSWDELETKQKCRSTLRIAAQLEELSEERNTEPFKSTAHLIHRLSKRITYNIGIYSFLIIYSTIFRSLFIYIKFNCLQIILYYY